MGRKRVFGTEAVWRERLGRFRDGDLKVAEFCRREGISQPSFYQWRKRLGVASRKGRRKRQVDCARDPEFVPLELPTSLLAGGVQIELPGGTVVRLPENVSAEIVAATVRAVCASDFKREASPC